jgi:VWFA-related protein
VDVVVRNKTGAVTGLTKDDFTLLDKGKPQNIQVFAATATRDEGDKPSPPSPMVGTNRVTRGGEVVRSATIILFDRLNTPASDQAYIGKQVLETLASLKGSEIFGFYSLGKGLSVVHDFTEDPGPLIRAATRLRATPPQAAPGDPAEQAAQKALEGALVPMQDLDVIYRVAETARAFQSITRHLSGLPGRKGVVWITRTFPLTFGADFNRRGELEKELTAATVTLQEENVALYPINPGGVGTGFNDGVTQSTEVEGRLMPGSNSSIAQDSGTLSDNSTLENIAAATGGIAYYNLNEITSKVQEATRDTDLTYSLGYSPENKMLDGKFHDFVIKVKASGATVRYRKRYLATKEDPRRQTPAVPVLAADPLEATAIQLAAVGQPDSARPGFQRADVSVNVNDLTMNHSGDHWAGAFELGLAVNGEMGGAGALQIFNLNLTDQQLHQAQTSGLIVHGAIEMRSGPVTLRAIVRDKTSGAAGAVRVPLPVH